MTYAEQSVERFLSEVASSRVAPSAGAATALTGALAAALCEMVCIHTSDPTTRLAAAHEALAEERQRLLALVDEDGAAVDEVRTAFEASSDADNAQSALRTATEVPLRIAEAAGRVAEGAVVVAEEGTPNARIDAVVGASLARAAVSAAATIVRVNLDFFDDEAFVRDARNRLEAAEADAADAVAAVTGG
ncbi:cyclodeaminase/cyclohydrolase family protein [Haloarcula marina]|uniref:cyclodeaminase/cyclohydrolase family protein n=1 Tax=Haloarcula marina TaxID=2961574 RepID=UPI0020B70166|nr:cyclodeaminase/cyclohydrolase family protein [Halomicroarcula marina]